ncbi:MAG: hypothetical protein NDJ90_14430 [Oligoflexia bacterium]|nr:hypothetical protein [Oligoflexia bacterium]
MKSFTYNDMDFSVEKSGNGWDVLRKNPDGKNAIVAAGVYPGIGEGEAGTKAETLVKSIYPVGVKTVGPDVAHPTLIGDVKIVFPDVAHPNFIYWDKKSASFPKNIG